MLVLVAACGQQPVPLAPPNTAVTPATHAKFPIASGVHAVSCDSCHGGFASFQQFTCLNCHAHDRALTDELHRSVDSGYAYASGSCLSCHATGTRVAFDHRGVTSACATCHDSGKPFDPFAVAGHGLDGGSFVHPEKGGNDCGACHVLATWLGAHGAPDGVRDPSQDVVVAAEVPSYSGTSITALAPRNETLPMPMFHSSPAVASVECAACHPAASSGVLFPGRLHASLTTQPPTCLECHAASAPVGFVGPTDAARTPASGAMKHDAVLWSGVAPTTTRAAPQECSLCHVAPPASVGWATSQKFHASVGAQPSSCLDCHANSRPAFLTSANAALPAGVEFDHSTATGDCISCHASGSFTSWARGKFHLAGSATPSSCLPCHQGERPTSTAGWRSATYAAFPFDYATHGAGLDCATCHVGPGTGAWGSTQNWIGGSFAHAPSSLAGATCLTCHSTQRPDLVLGQTVAAALLPGRFDHAVSGTADCFSCHQGANAYAAYFSPSGTLPGGGWAGGIGAADGVRDPTQDIVVLAEVPVYAGASIASVTAQRETLTMPMFHSSATVPQSMSCSACHAGAASGTFFPGRLHASLATQPAACIDCHAASAPVGFVGPIDAGRSPASGAMKHDAVVWSNGARTTTPAAPQECALCHLAPPTAIGWATSVKFHASAQPISCLDCHANSRPTAPLTSANAALPAGVQFDHSTATAECTACHANGSYSSWAGGKFHLAGSATPSSCSSCHQAERPTSTAGWVSNTWRTTPFDFATHGAGQDCVTCHAGPGTGSWGGTQNWVGGNFSHSASSLSANTCVDCHSTQRPNPALLTSANAALPAGVQFDHSTATGDCTTCHASGSFTNWTGGKLHLAGSAPPTSCFSCHQGERPTSTAGWVSNTWRSAPFDFATHGAGLDCATCHAGPGTGNWGGTQNWVGGNFTHSASSLAANTCVDCHSTQRPDPALLTSANAALPAGVQFDHSTATGDCISCHASGSFTSWTGGKAHLAGSATPSSCLSCHQGERPTSTSGWVSNTWRGAPFDFATHGAGLDCATCHAGPGTGSWGGTQNWVGGNFAHSASSLAATTCVACHSTQRPTALLTSTNAALPAGVQFDHSTATGNCTTCHVSGSFSSWTGGKLHLAGSATPSSCLPCHQGERPTSTAGWVDGSYRTSPFDYATHGAGQDCAVCHGGPGSGAWGGTQNWTGGKFGHGAWSLSATTCIACHATERPDLVLGQAKAASLLAGNFDHAVKGTADCFSCHQATVAANAFVNYFNGVGTLPGGDWAGGLGAPDGVRDPSRDVALTAQVPTYASTSIVALTAQPESLPMPMFHTSATLRQAIACSSCHAGASAGVFFPGHLHSALTALGFAQPATCADCHADSAPAGFVGPVDARRSPASGEMKHDAVLWSGGARTTTRAVPQECSLCHQPSSWATSQKFHASAQPASCLDCHANSRPTAVLTPANAALPAGVQFDHSAGAALRDCATCHGGSFSSWTGGQFHLAASATPSTCLPCHQDERPTSTAGWISTTYQVSPFDYVTNTAGVTHGAGQDCVTCHASPGTGSWGGTQNWASGNFAHATSLVAGNTCIACHSTQRPDLVLRDSAALLHFDHALRGTGDCRGCHAATVAANAYVHYFNASGTLPGGDWSGGVSYPGSTLISAPGQVITVPEMILSRSAQTGLVTGASTITATLNDAMLHVSTALPPELNAGPTANPDPSKCWHCHTNTNGAVTSYTNGLYHSSLDNYQATPGAPVTPLPQPTGRCSECHAQTRPSGIVQWAGFELQPMDHDAAFTSGASANQIDCSSCHRQPGSTWAGGVFHAPVASALPLDCTVCHYPLMADAATSDVTSGVSYAMSHRSAQLGFQNCKLCHVSALASSTTTPLGSALWNPGAFHSSVAPQPGSCNDCHAPVSVPAVPTQSVVSYAFAAGATGSNERQWMSHASAWVVGKDCATCHAADAAPGVTAWNNSDSFHSAVVGVTSCAECHGLAGGNNLPAGLTDSSVVSSAAGDGTSGVPADTHDQITHADLNVALHDCNFCHTQAGASTAPDMQGREWAQASFHSSFGPANPLTVDGRTGRCSNCHMNVKPPAGSTVEDHGGLSAEPGTQDCSSCHSWPGTGTPSAPNWLGAAGFPLYISVGGFTVPAPPAPEPDLEPGVDSLPHPIVNDACTACHTSESGGRHAIGYDHASVVGATNCNACHEAGSDLVGAVWNGATSESLGAGDTRPFTLPTVYAAYSGGSGIVTWPNHFYSSGTRIVDCSECHVVPLLYGATTTGNAYLKIGRGGSPSTGVWAFPHYQWLMTYPDTCKMCHGNNIPPD